NNPRFAIIVVVDEPVGLHQGGSVSAPIFNLIAEAALGDYAVPPDDKRFREILATLSQNYESSVEQEPPPVIEPAEIEIVKAEASPSPTAEPAATNEPVRSEMAKGDGKMKSDRSGTTASANITKASVKSALTPSPTPAKPPPIPSPEVETYLMPD